MHKFIVKIPFVIFGLTFSKLEYAEINRVNLLKIDFFFSMFHSLQTKINCTKDQNLFSIKTPLTEELLRRTWVEFLTFN